MTATNDAVLITDPPPAWSRWGIPCLQQRKTLPQVHVLDPLPGLERRLEHGGVVGRVDAGVVEENVDPAELLASPGVHPLDLGLVGDVGLDRELALRASGDIDAGDPCALRGEEPRRVAPMPLAAPGDDADLSLQPPAI